MKLRDRVLTYIKKRTLTKKKNNNNNCEKNTGLIFALLCTIAMCLLYGFSAETSCPSEPLRQFHLRTFFPQDCSPECISIISLFDVIHCTGGSLTFKNCVNTSV